MHKRRIYVDLFYDEIFGNFLEFDHKQISRFPRGIQLRLQGSWILGSWILSRDYEWMLIERLVKFHRSLDTE